MTEISASVYWIRSAEHTDPMTEGNVGVSKNFDKRMIGHHTSIQKGSHKNPHLVHAVEKYGWDNLIKEIIFAGDEVECYVRESELRPIKAVGWNIAPGGHRGPGWTPRKKRSSEYLEKMRIKNAARRAATMDKK